MVHLPGPEELFGNFQSPSLSNIIQEYLSLLPSEDLPSEGMLNRTVLFLRTLFYNLGPEHEYRWEGDVTGGAEHEHDTGVTISVEPSIASEVVEQRPAILVNLGDRRFMNLHLGQIKHWNIHSNIETFHDLISGGLSVHVIARHSHVCRRLSEWIALNFSVLRKVLTFAGFHAIRPDIFMGKVQDAGELVEGSDKTFMSATCGFGFTWDWTARVASTSELKVGSIRVDAVLYNRPALDGSGAGGDIVVPDDDPVTQIVLEQQQEE